METQQYELTGSEWDRVKDMLPPEQPKTGKRGHPAKYDNRSIMNGILWIARTGAPWRGLPERYGTKEILSYIKEHGATVVIPPKSNAKEPWAVDYYLYKERHLVECFFQKIKWFRRVATRYDKLDKSFLAFVYMAAIMIWLL